MMLVARGDPYKTIAADLGISINTVESHLKHIYLKLNVKCRTEAALIFITKEKMTEIRD